jgi:molybdopterin converting factor small subunit
MAIEVRIPTILRSYTDGAKAVEGTGASLGELFKDLDSRHPGIAERLLDAGELRRFVNVYLNDEDVRFLEKMETTVKADDVISIVPSIAGGCLQP